MKIKYDPKNEVVAIELTGAFVTYVKEGKVKIFPLGPCEKPEIIEAQLLKPVKDEAL